jgi:hypothetical protein
LKLKNQKTYPFNKKITFNEKKQMAITPTTLPPRKQDSPVPPPVPLQGAAPVLSCSVVTFFDPEEFESSVEERSFQAISPQAATPGIQAIQEFAEPRLSPRREQTNPKAAELGKNEDPFLTEGEERTQKLQTFLINKGISTILEQEFIDFCQVQIEKLFNNLASEHPNRIQPSDTSYFFRCIMEEILAGIVVFSIEQDESYKITAIEKISLHESTKDHAFFKACQALIKKGELDKAIALAERISHEYIKDDAFNRICRGLIEKGELDKATALAVKISRENIKDHAFRIICEALIEKGELDKAIALAVQISHENIKDHAFRIICEALIEKGELDKATTLAVQISHENIKGFLLQKIDLKKNPFLPK